MTWFRYSNFGAWWHGRIDGKLGIPAVNQDQYADYEMGVKQATEATLRQIAEQWEHLDTRLKAEYCAAEAERLAAESALKRAESEHETAQQEYNSARTEAGQHTPDISLSPTWYWIIIVILGIAEFPLNAIVFRLFGEAELLTYGMTAGLAVALLACAHFWGMSYRRQKAVECAVLAIVPLAAIIGIAYLRELYLGEMHSADVLTVRVSPLGATLVFIAINELIFLVAAVASYHSHDPRPEVVRTQRVLKDATKRFRIAVGHLEWARRRAGSAEQRYRQTRSEREQTFAKRKQEGSGMRDSGQALVSVYRSANMRARAARHGADRPKSFNDLPDIGMPQILTQEAELDWICSLPTGS